MFRLTGAIDVKMGKMLGLSFSSKLDWGSYILSIAKSASRKMGALICSMKFLSPALYPYKSTMRFWIKHCCPLSCYLKMLDKLQERVCRTVGSSLAASLEPLTLRYLVGAHLNWLNWFHFLLFVRGLLVILTDCMTFLSQFLDVVRMSVSTVFSSHSKALEFPAGGMVS